MVLLLSESFFYVFLCFCLGSKTENETMKAEISMTGMSISMGIKWSLTSTEPYCIQVFMILITTIPYMITDSV